MLQGYGKLNRLNRQQSSLRRGRCKESPSWQEQDQGRPQSSSTCSLNHSCHKCSWQKTPLASWQPPCALFQVPHSIPKCDIIQLPVPLNNYTPLEHIHTQKTTKPGQFSLGNKHILLSCVTFPVGELSAASANMIPMAVLKILPQVLVLYLTPALLGHSWLTPGSSAQPPSQAPWFYFILACPL